MKKHLLSYSIVLFLWNTIFAQINPAKQYGELFVAVQKGKIFDDQKMFVDCPPRFHADTIMKRYRKLKDTENFDLNEFVQKHFVTMLYDTASIINHINHLWNYLTRKANKNEDMSSLINLPYPYIVPGGRFREVYYWDSYFTMLGLQESGRYDIIENMINNFAYLIDTYGHIPNGNRTYYLSRSQPPFFSLMVKILAEHKGQSIYIKYLPQLEKEYTFWMDGKRDDIQGGFPKAKKRIVTLGKRNVVNRYWDAEITPRPESYLNDVTTKESSKRDSSIYRDLRASAESGWDFSSRWFVDSNTIYHIHTIDIIPVDLNCLLYNLEMTIAKGYTLQKDRVNEKKYLTLAKSRKEVILEVFWNEKNGYFFDYNFKKDTWQNRYTLAGVYPLFFKLLEDNEKVNRVFECLENRFLKDGGLVTTTIETGEQWDSPNGWAPLQWIGYMACKNYKKDDLARDIAKRWTKLNVKIFFETGKMTEKYNVVDIHKPGGGGEYELQDGFGWTNGVFLKLWRELHSGK